MPPNLPLKTVAEAELGFTSLQPTAALLLWPGPNRTREMGQEMAATSMGEQKTPVASHPNITVLRHD